MLPVHSRTALCHRASSAWIGGAGWCRSALPALWERDPRRRQRHRWQPLSELNRALRASKARRVPDQRHQVV